MVSPEYFESDPCRAEMYAACKRATVASMQSSASFEVITTVFGQLPDELVRFESGWFGESQEDKQHGTVIEQRMGQLLPRPSDGVFEDDFAANLERLLERLRVAGVAGVSNP